MFGKAHVISVKAATGSMVWLVICGMDRMGVLPTACMVLVHLTIRRIPGGARTSPMHVCLVALKVLAKGQAKLFCLSIPGNLKVRHTFVGGPREPRRDSW